MSKQSSGIVTDNMLLTIGRTILRKQVRDNRIFSDTEIMGFAISLQNSYNFVKKKDQIDSFCNEVIRAFRYLEQRELKSISYVAYTHFRFDEWSGNSIFDELLIEDFARVLK